MEGTTVKYRWHRCEYGYINPIREDKRKRDEQFIVLAPAHKDSANPTGWEVWTAARDDDGDLWLNSIVDDGLPTLRAAKVYAEQHLVGEVAA